MRIAVYPGSFDPITNGHLDVLKRALGVFDEVILLLAVNPAKKSVFTLQERLAMMKEATAGIKGVLVDYYSGLTVDYCRKHQAKHLIRGLRAVTDFEYEFQLAAANEFADPDIDMVFFMSRKEETFISSSTINELYANGIDISALVPPTVVKFFKAKKRK
ncbi:MAG: pantetheine-phosphate adenylyltransferase [Bacilli bacterium]|jgi:pantetheine-phosphate adenylyltransferase|nr:pantetheine-phosphate adenylyltransferase [Bacilli bacterium]